MSDLELLRLDGLSLNGPGGPQVTNLILNPSAGVSATGGGTVAANATMVRDASQYSLSATDTASFKLTSIAAGDISVRHDSSGRFAVTPGVAYSAAAEFKAQTSPRSCRIHLDWYDAGGVRISVPNGASVTSNTSGFTRAVFENAVAPAGAATADVICNVLGVAAANEVHWVDVLIANSGATVHTYFDGDQGGYSWTGVAHASTSTSSPFTLESLSMPPPKKRPEWTSGADADGALLARDPLHDNREITARIRVEPQASMNAALDKIGLIIDKLEEAERNEGGIALVWTPAQSTRSVTFYVLSGEVTDLPIEVAGDGAGWFVLAPVVTVTMTAKPFGYGTEVLSSSVSSTEPVVTLELTGVAGDVPAEARVIVTDNASKDRRLVRCGLESRWYPTSSSPGLILDSDALVTSGFTGVQAHQGTAGGIQVYDTVADGFEVVQCFIPPGLAVPIAVCGLGNLSHVGSFRVFARANLDVDAVVRLVWRDGDGPERANTYAAPPVLGPFAEVDLGIVTIEKATSGTQRWTGRIEVLTRSTTSAGYFRLDYLALMPCGEGYVEARAPYTGDGGQLGASDAAWLPAALNGQGADVGGTWSTSGSTTDFTGVAGPAGSASTYTANRATTSDTGPRYAICGSTNYTAVDVQIRNYASPKPGPTTQGVIARWTDANNHLRLKRAGAQSTSCVVEKVISGTATQIAAITSTIEAEAAWVTMRLVVFPSGTCIAMILNATGSELGRAVVSDTDLATGGTLATGKPGFLDANTTASACSRFYDRFVVSVPTEPIACYSGQPIEFRTDGVLRKDSTGAYWGVPPSARGSGIYIQPAGTAGRKTRVAVMARRGDLVTSADTQIQDSTTVQVAYTPRFLAVPR